MAIETIESNEKPAIAEASTEIWSLSTGSREFPEWTEIVVPHAGTLTVIYDWKDQPADGIWVRGTDGIDTPIDQGLNKLEVREGARLMYRIIDRKNQIFLYFSME